MLQLSAYPWYLLNWDKISVPQQSARFRLPASPMLLMAYLWPLLWRILWLSKELNARDEVKEHLLAELHGLRKRVAELGALRHMSTRIDLCLITASSTAPGPPGNSTLPGAVLRGLR